MNFFLYMIIVSEHNSFDLFFCLISLFSISQNMDDDDDYCKNSNHMPGAEMCDAFVFPPSPYSNTNHYQDETHLVSNSSIHTTDCDVNFSSLGIETDARNIFNSPMGTDPLSTNQYTIDIPSLPSTYPTTPFPLSLEPTGSHPLSPLGLVTNTPCSPFLTHNASSHNTHHMSQINPLQYTQLLSHSSTNSNSAAAEVVNPSSSSSLNQVASATSPPSRYALKLDVAAPSSLTIWTWILAQPWGHTINDVELVCGFPNCRKKTTSTGATKKFIYRYNVQDLSERTSQRPVPGIVRDSELWKRIDSYRSHCGKNHRPLNPPKRQKVAGSSSSSATASSHTASSSQFHSGMGASVAQLVNSQHHSSTSLDDHPQESATHLFASPSSDSQNAGLDIETGQSSTLADPSTSPSSSSSFSSSMGLESLPSNTTKLELTNLCGSSSFSFSFRNISEESLREQLSRFTHVTELSILYCAPSDPKILLKLFPKLKIFNVTYWDRNLSGPVLTSSLREIVDAAIVQSHLQLHSLYFHHVPHLEAIFGTQTMGSRAKFRKITVISEDTEGFSESGVQALAFLPHLKDLSFRIAPSVKMSVVATKGTFRHLRFLEMFFSLPISTEVFTHLKHLTRLESCRLIVSVDTAMEPMDDDSFGECLKGWTRLSMLSMNSFQLASRCFRHIVQAQSLTFLRIERCPLLEAEALVHLSQLPLLRELHIESYGSVCLLKNSSLLTTLAFCQSLVSVVYSDNSDLDDWDVIIPNLTQAQYQHLRSISFEYECELQLERIHDAQPDHYVWR
jgi:hypothetical protein